jgi:hypothetical protein
MFFAVAICLLARVSDAICVAKIPNVSFQHSRFHELEGASVNQVVSTCLKALSLVLKRKSERTPFSSADSVEVAEHSKDRVVCRFLRQGRVVARVVMLPPVDYSRLSL